MTVNKYSFFHLSEEDTTLTFFKDHYPERAVLAKKDQNANLIKFDQVSNNKINQICSRLIEICEKTDEDKFYLVILYKYMFLNS